MQMDSKSTRLKFIITRCHLFRLRKDLQEPSFKLDTHLAQSRTQLRQLSEHQETIKEEERRRIARDIHDDLGQNLMALKIDVTLLQGSTGEGLNVKVQRMLNTIDETIKSVRVIINDLNPGPLELGLLPAIEGLLRRFECHSAINCMLHVAHDSANVVLDQRHTAAAFRIIQESLTNIARHAHADAVQITLNFQPDFLSIVIADNGIGMQAGDCGKEASFGLKGIRERLNAFGGALRIASGNGAGAGTTLAILLPLSCA